MKYTFILLFFFSIQIVVGQTTFQNTFTFKNSATVTQLLSTADGETTIVGYTNTPIDYCEDYSYCNSTVFAYHFNKKGVLIWNKNYSSNLAYSRVKAGNTRDGGFVLFGRLYDTATRTSKGGLFIKCDKDGDIVWKKQIFSKNYGFQPQIVQQDEQGNFLLISLQGYWDGGIVDILKLNNKGDVLWNTVTEQAFFGDLYHVNSLVQKGNKYYITGYSTCEQCVPKLETSGLIIINTEGKILSIRGIFTKDSRGYTIDAIVYKLFIYNRILYAYGYCDQKAFILPITDTSTNVNATVIGDDIFTLQRYLKNKDVFPFQLGDFTWIDNNKSIKSTSGNDNRRIFFSQYDSLNRICPNFTKPSIDTSISSRLFTIETWQEFYLQKDSVYAQGGNATAVTNEVNYTVFCRGEAIENTNLDNLSNVITSNNKGINIFPNPANEIIHINGIKSKAVIEIFSSFGIKEKSLIVNGNNVDINISNLTKGVYLIKIIEQNREPYLSTFLKTN